MNKKVLKREYVVMENEEMGTRAYANSLEGRAMLEADLSGTEEGRRVLEEILCVWGESPVVEEMEYTEPKPIPDPTGQRLDEIEAAIAELAYGEV